MGEIPDVAETHAEAGLGEATDLQNQKQIDSMDASTLTEAVQKLNTDIQRITSRMRASLVSAEAAVAGLLPTDMASTEAATAATSPEQAGKISADVADSNPHSRLMALQRMGVVQNYEQIQSCTVAVVGIGGVGSVAAEMLTRCGVGCLLLYDYDSVKPCNLNRMFYRPDEAGMAKTDAAAASLTELNPGIRIESYNINITTVAGFEEFRSSLTHAATGKSRIHLLLSCVDNYEARVHINRVCLDLQQDWMESGVSEDAVSGHIQMIAPGKTACFECAPPLAIASGLDENTLKREDVCSASLPTTMNIISGLLVQNALKFLLGFGDVAQCLGYMALSDYFPRQRMRPNPECSQNSCIRLQQEFRKMEPREIKQAAKQLATNSDDANKVHHEENEWNICVLESVSPVEDSKQTTMPDQPCVTVPNSTLTELMAELEETQQS